ncbi:MAG: flagellar motor switch protein FliN [Nitrospirae bacterium]|nr:MAG: flagellar motor switch protein FliN [Nitrospirota bacterium]
MSESIEQDDHAMVQQDAAASAVEAQAEAGALTKSAQEPGIDHADLQRILDIPLVLSAQLGSAKLLIKELLQLGPGSVVELDKLAGEPLEVFVNDKLVARGEVVMINEKYGIRLTDVVSPTERVNKLA